MFEKTVKSIGFVTVALIFFYICGGLYLVGFWSTFRIDISNFIGISDVPKTFIYPFMVTMAFVMIYATFNALTLRQLREGNSNSKKEDTKPFKRPFIWRLFTNNIFITVFLLACAVLYFFFQYSIEYWLIVIFLFGFIMLIKLRDLEIMRKLFDTKFLILIKFCFVLFPLICFITGKVISLDIYHNREIKIVKGIKDGQTKLLKDTTTFKLVGFISDKAVISTLNNEKMILLNLSAFDGLIVDSVINNKKIYKWLRK